MNTIVDEQNLDNTNTEKVPAPSKTTKKKKASKRDVIFYVAFMIFPVVQFLIMYVVVNFNSILLAFQEFDIVSDTSKFVGFENIKEAFLRMTGDDEFIGYFFNSLKFYSLQLVIGTPLALLFSYYIFKKGHMSGIFRVFLYLPSVISALVMVTIFNYFVERAIPAYASTLFGTKMLGLLENPETRFGTLVFFNIWAGFGVSVLMYSNAMSGISPDIIEAGKIDGVTGFKEFLYLVVPNIFPTFSMFLIMGLAGLFTNQFYLFSFFSNSAPQNVSSFGYYLYNTVQMATNKAQYPFLSAIGIILTAVTMVIVYTVKYLLDKYGPSED